MAPVAGEPLTLQRMLGWVCAPLAWVMGVEWQDAHTVGILLGEKTIFNEFVAYQNLMQYKDVLSERSSVCAMTYFGGEKAVPGYNVMGVCKAALDSCVKYAAFDLGPADQLARHRHIKVTEEQCGKGHAVNNMDKHQPGGGIRQPQPAQRLRHRQDHHLERDKAAKQHQTKEQVAAAKLPLGQHIAVKCTEQGRDQYRRYGDLERVPEEGADTLAANTGTGT